VSSRFNGQVALVTGGGKGIGAAACMAFATEGAAVAVLDFDRDAAQTVASKIEEAGGRAHAIHADVRRGADAERAVADTVKSFGRLDVLVNNAGVVRYGEVPDFGEDDWDFVVDTNLKGVFLMSKYAIPVMRQRGGGAIVNAASVQAFASQHLVAAYSASKGGVVSITRTLALDHAKDNIRVNCYCPGSVLTPMLRYAAQVFAADDPDAAVELWGRNHPIGRVIEPEEVAKLILFLASADASAITGSPHFVDGGLLAKLGV
jgi:NAD(P)-dependent dehydrogenase (short-subunit alcohol dehydrogenase family)